MPMNITSEVSELLTLQKTFDVTALGFGDTVVGLNVLGAMACTLANLAPDDGTVVYPSSRRAARVGTSFLVLGSASAGRVVDEVISEVCRRQSNLKSHLRRYIDWTETMIKEKLDTTPRDKNESESYSLIRDIQYNHSSGIHSGTHSWARAFDTVPSETIQHFAKRTKFMISAGKPDDLASQLSALRPGRPLVHLGFSCPQDLSRFAETGAALLEGRHPVGDGHEAVRGNIIVTDPMRVLVDAANETDSRTGWLGQLLWLCDGHAGPDAPDDESGTSPENNSKIVERFQKALTVMMTRRMYYESEGVGHLLVLCGSIEKAMPRWTDFLQQVEPNLPGISGACRNLLASLILGIGEMAKLGERPLKFSLASVEALARFLVRRMANNRLSILCAGEIVRRQNQIQRIFGKIGKGPIGDQKIAKDLKIAAVERDECLRWLTEAGLVSRGTNGWELCEGARLDFNKCAVPLLEIQP